MRKNTVTVEMQDGTIHGPVRVIFADKVRAEKSFRANGWNLGEENVRLEGFFGWAATKREGMHDISYDEFLEQLIDVNFESAVQGDEGEDPTTSGGRD